MEISNIFDNRPQIRILHQALLTLSLIIAFYSYIAFAARVSGKIYTNLQSSHYCARRLNATHQVGCSSELGGNTGVVWVVENDVDLDHIKNSGPTPPYIAVLRSNYFTKANLLEFKQRPSRVSGVIYIVDTDSYSEPSSPESICPISNFGLYANDTDYAHCKANTWQEESAVSGLLYEDIPFPIFLINDKKSIQTIETCYKQHNRLKEGQVLQSSYPLCSMQLDGFMLAAKNSKTCLNSHSVVDELLQSNGRRCNYIMIENLFAFYKPAFGPLKPYPKSNLMAPEMVEPQSIVMLIARLNSLAMFTDFSPGADSTVSSIVTILAIAEALGKVRSNKDVINSKRNIAISLLDFDAFDYSGSVRMVTDMNNNVYPNAYFRTTNVTDAINNLNLSSIDYIINLDQVSMYPNQNTIYMHTDPKSEDSTKKSELSDILNKVAKQENVPFVEEQGLPLPPASVQEFILGSRASAANHRPYGVVLSNYAKKFTNRHYYSIFDNTQNIYQVPKQDQIDHLARVASYVAKSLYRLTFGADAENLEIDKKTIGDLLDCYLVNGDCRLFTRACRAGQKVPDGPIQTYKDATKRSDDINGAITFLMLSYYLGERLPDYNISQCMYENERSLIYNYQFINDKDQPVTDSHSGVCIRSQVMRTSDASPAYEQTDTGIRVDAKYPAWTVSLSNMRHPVRIYLQPSPWQEWSSLILGILITILSFFIVSHCKNTLLATPETPQQATLT